MKGFRRLAECHIRHDLAGSVCLGKGPQPETPLAGAVAETLRGAASSITLLLSTSWPSPHRARICLVVKPETNILCPAGMKTKVNNPQ